LRVMLPGLLVLQPELRQARQPGLLALSVLT
jgi:hypothetical protein